MLCAANASWLWLLVMVILSTTTTTTRSLLLRPTTRSAAGCRFLSATTGAELLSHPAAQGLVGGGGARGKLARRHLPLFETESLFDRIGRAVCETGVVPRKELFECFETASHIHRHFPSVRRVADCCSGHGLLSWMLLLLDDESPPTSSSSSSRTAVCVDVRMPASAEAIESAMRRAFPALLAQRWSFVEAPLEAVEPHPSCLLAAVHACGGLSDTVVAKAIAAGAPVALVPCCHTLSRRKGFNPHPLAYLHGDHGGDDAAGGGTLEVAGEAAVEAAAANAAALVAAGRTDLAGAVDGLRMTALARAGYEVCEELLPTEFTARNRLIIGVAAEATKMTTQSTATTKTTATTETTTTTTTTTTKGSIGHAPRRMPRGPAAHQDHPRRQPPLLRLPTADDPASIAACASASGRRAAAQRKQAPPPFLDVSCWLPSPAAGGGGGGGAAAAYADAAANAPSALTAESLEAVANEIAASAHAASAAKFPSGIFCRVGMIDCYTRPTDGRQASTFRVHYETKRGPVEECECGDPHSHIAEEFAVVDRTIAKELHGSLVTRIESTFRGASVRL